MLIAVRGRREAEILSKILIPRELQSLLRGLGMTTLACKDEHFAEFKDLVDGEMYLPGKPFTRPGRERRLSGLRTARPNKNLVGLTTFGAHSKRDRRTRSVPRMSPCSQKQIPSGSARVATWSYNGQVSVATPFRAPV